MPNAQIPLQRESAQAGRPSPKVAHERIRRLSELNPWMSGGYILFLWIAIGAAAFVCIRHWHPVLYLVTVAFIGARQHDLGTMIHEATHFRLARNRRANEWFGEALTWPFLILSLRDYRTNHLLHHNYLNSERDPDWVSKQNEDWQFPLPPMRVWILFFKDLIGVGLVNTLVRTRQFPKLESGDRDPPQERAMFFARITFIVLAAAAIWHFNGWKTVLLFWIVPFVTWLQLCLHLRSIAEHFALDPTREGFDTRTVLPNALDRMFVLSNATSLHGEHHFFPSVPFYRLSALHLEIEDDDAYRQRIEVSRGYWDVVKACWKGHQRIAAASRLNPSTPLGRASGKG